MKNSFMNLSVMPERTFENQYEKKIPHHERIYAKCDLCGQDILCGEDYYRYKFNNICNREDCMKELSETLMFEYKKFAV